MKWASRYESRNKLCLGSASGTFESVIEAFSLIRSGWRDTGLLPLVFVKRALCPTGVAHGAPFNGSPRSTDTDEIYIGESALCNAVTRRNLPSEWMRNGARVPICAPVARIWADRYREPLLFPFARRFLSNNFVHFSLPPLVNYATRDSRFEIKAETEARRNKVGKVPGNSSLGSRKQNSCRGLECTRVV